MMAMEKVKMALYNSQWPMYCTCWEEIMQLGQTECPWCEKELDWDTPLIETKNND